ncbi:MAG: hypothetical protein AABW51_04920 [Nanoarchaeota archaeon]
MKSEQELINHIEKHENSSLVRAVLAGNTTFKREARRFYDLEVRIIAGRGMAGKLFNFKKESTLKLNQNPTELIELLQPFSDEPIDKNKLDYEKVREDYKRWHSGLRKLKIVGINIGKLSILIGSAFITANNLDNLLLAVPSGAITVVGSFLYNKILPTNKPPKNTNYEFIEYMKIDDAVYEADGFMDKQYRKYFVGKNLKTK